MAERNEKTLYGQQGDPVVKLGGCQSNKSFLNFLPSIPLGPVKYLGWKDMGHII